MAGQFMTEDFLLQTKTARTLYHEHAANMPIYDYHCHLPAQQIAADHRFENLTQAWLSGDHYKWRAMRTNGVPERFVTGDASDWEKFEKWAATVPACLGNPLYHWTHLELHRPFGITGRLLGPGHRQRDLRRVQRDAPLARVQRPQHHAEDERQARLHDRRPARHPGASSQDPAGRLRGQGPHRLAAGPGDGRRRPARSSTPSSTSSTSCATCDIADFADYIEALRERHGYFHEHGCRLSDHGLETAYAEDYTDSEIKAIFAKIRAGRSLSPREVLQFKSAMMVEFGLMDAERGWVQQLHLGALRNNCTRLFKKLGPDIGCDSIGDFEVARPLSQVPRPPGPQGRLPKTILYNLNPRDNAVCATMIGNFQDGSVPGKLQYGSGWWFLDQKDGMEDQMRTLANMGLLSRFVGMLTDSRSFLSYPRHEYFRRVLCNLLGSDVEAGLLPNDLALLGKMVEDISYNNARAYFPMECS